MRDCLNAMKPILSPVALWRSGAIALAATLLFLPSAAWAVLDPIKDLTLQTEDTVEDDQCQQAWPVDCSEGGGGSSGCGGWAILKNLAEAESLPVGSGSTCSTGVRIALDDPKATQGQAVGAMFNGLVVFSQAGKSRDGRDYGGTVVIKLDLEDGSPQCFARYMFLDRRDLVRTGAEVKAGQRIGSVASNDMNPSKDWWQKNWPGMNPQVKIDIGCDEALLNLPHFMPREQHNGGGVENPNTCPLTKLRFPAPPLTYLVNTDHGGNPECHVGVRKDAREGIKAAKPQDDSEKNLSMTGVYVDSVKPRGIIKRKETPVFSLFKNETSRDNYYGANRQRSNGSILFRNHINYRPATSLSCANMEEIFQGKNGDSITPEQVRELLTHCTNQFILTKAIFSKVFEQGNTSATGLLERLPDRMLNNLTEEERERYEEAWEEHDDGIKVFEEMEREITRVYWRDVCQPLAMEKVDYTDYEPRDLLAKAWTELLIEWPQEHEYTPINRDPLPDVDLNSYTDYPYERINDPSNPFSPRHIFAETERERYSNYGVQCAATPVDIILGTYGEGTGDDPLKTYGTRDEEFQQCIRCRIEINEDQDACFADPYSFETAGGCMGGFGLGNTAGQGELCDNLDQNMLDMLDDLEKRYGLYPQILQAVATQESGCSAERGVVSHAGAMGMFQFMPGTAAGYGIDPWDPVQAAEAAAKFLSSNAEMFNCRIDLMLAGYNAGPYDPYIQSGSVPPYEETQGYVANITHMLGGATNGCSQGGPYPAGNGPTSGTNTGANGGGGGSSGGGGNNLIDWNNLFGSSGNGASNASIGRFDPSGCPAGYVGNQYAFKVTGSSTSGSGDGDSGGSSGGSSNNTCAPYSYPTPDLPGPGTFGCHARDFYPPGCDADCQHRFNVRCDPIRAYYQSGGASRASVCSSPACLPRIHEGMDITFEYGAPVYASADGVVKNINEDGTFLTVDHSGKCIDPECKKRFPQGTDTRYYHMGTKRIIVEEGQEVTRCQQIGSVGDSRSEGVPHLHWEAWEAGSKMGGNITAHWGLAQDENFHAHIDDKSCTGGIWDADGNMGGRGICQHALPVNTMNKEDLTPPDYFEEYELPEVEMPNPPSEKRGDDFELDVPGMVYEGAWKACDNVPSHLKQTCEELNEEKEEDKKRISSSEYINPLPCHGVTSPFGWRIHPISGARKFHSGMDIAPPGGMGPPSFAVADGVIIAAGDGCVAGAMGCNGGAGNYVTVQHADGKSTRYLHHLQLCPQSTVGATVVQGQVLGIVGTTGSSTGDHLHFEVYENGAAIDPQPLIPAQTQGAAECPQINTMQCGQTIDGQPVGGGVGSSKTLCVDKPCTVRYDQADTVSACGFPEDANGCGTLGHFSQRAEGENKDCCFNITAPVNPLNVLKIRPGYDNEVLKPGSDDKEEYLEGAWEGVRVDDGVSDGLKGEGGTAAVSADNPGAPEGYTFHEHFRKHRPYMRWWDTGAEAGNVVQETADAESPAGWHDTLVGVGIEKNNCGIGGWGEADKLDGNTSWMELKLYQARAQHLNGLRCISRYERVFKRGSSEDYALKLAGGDFNSSVTSGYSSGTIAFNFPLGWRGYASENEPAYRFPYYKTEGEPDLTATLVGGLDSALPGDIVVWDKDTTGETSMQHVAFVVRADNETTRSNSGSSDPSSRLTGKRFFPSQERVTGPANVTVLDYNHGRYPDACGNTNWWAVGPERKLYKGTVPDTIRQMAERQGVTTLSCDNPDLASCIESHWGSVKVYRPRNHVRD